MTYDLRRLRRKGLIHRIPRSQRYELTDLGRMIAVFFTKTHVRILNPGLAHLDPQLPQKIAKQSEIACTWRAFEHAIDRLIQQAAIAA
jgi:Mn-dependent DtxR family transcriptional regulator